MRTRVAAALVVIGGIVGLSALPADAGVTLCYSASVTVNDSSVLEETNMPDCTRVSTP